LDLCGDIINDYKSTQSVVRNDVYISLKVLGQDGMVAAFLDCVAAVYDGTGLVNGIVIYMVYVCHFSSTQLANRDLQQCT